jgi:murein tripeptide amidase MpaA
VPGAAALVIALAVATGAPAEQHAPLATPLASTTKKLTISATTATSCTDRLASAGTLGVTATRWTAPVAGYVQARLNGDAGNDWDLALFDSRSGKRLDASLAWGSDELTQAWVKRGQSLTIQACRFSGPSAIEPLEITPVKIAGSLLDRKPPKESLVSIPIATKLDFSALEATGINLDEVPNRHGREALAVLAGPADAAKVRKAGYSFKTVIPDMAAAERGYRAQDRRFAARAKKKPSPLPSGRRGYRYYPDIQADLKKIVKNHPNLARKVTLPDKTFQGREMQTIEITKNVKAKDDGKPTFWFMGTHHAREWPAAEIPVEFALYLTRNFGRKQRVTNLLKRVRVVITPVINVDGYTVSRGAFDPADNSGDPAGAPSLAESVAPPGGSLAYRRKNCHGASDDPSTPCNLQYGIDNNRNYGAGWGGPGAGTDPNTQNYRGEDMWSEPENRAVWHFSQRHNVTTLITMHNFASLVLRPPGRHDDGLAPDETALKKLGDRMARDTGYTSEYGYQLYDTSGTTEDWNYAAAGTFGYTIEMGPDSSHGGNFHIGFQDAVIDQWTGAQTLDGKGKGLRDAMLAAGEAAADRKQFSTLRGKAPPGARLRVRKDFKTLSSDVCSLETTGYDCTDSTPREGIRSRKDFLDYTTLVPTSGRYDWIITPSTRPFELKKGRTERWTLTCEDPATKKVHEKRRITIDRGQKLVENFRCGAKRVPIEEAECKDKRTLRLVAHQPARAYIKRIDVYINGKHTQRLKGKKARRGIINLKGIKNGRKKYEVTVVVHLSDGRLRISKRTFKGCVKQGDTTTTDEKSRARR